MQNAKCGKRNADRGRVPVKAILAEMTQSAAGTCPTSCMMKKTAIRGRRRRSCPGAHRNEASGLRASRRNGRRSPLCDSGKRKQPVRKLRPFKAAAAKNGAWGETAHQPTEHRSRDHPEPETGAHEAEVPRALIAISDIGNISAGYRPSRPGDAGPRSARYREPKGKAPSP